MITKLFDLGFFFIQKVNVLYDSNEQIILEK